jgi:hypothetical protein
MDITSIILVSAVSSITTSLILCCKVRTLLIILGVLASFAALWAVTLVGAACAFALFGHSTFWVAFGGIAGGIAAMNMISGLWLRVIG